MIAEQKQLNALGRWLDTVTDVILNLPEEQLGMFTKENLKNASKDFWDAQREERKQLEELMEMHNCNFMAK